MSLKDGISNLYSSVLGSRDRTKDTSVTIIVPPKNLAAEKSRAEEIEAAIAKNFNYIKGVFGPELAETSYEEIKEKFLKGDMKSVEELNTLMGENSDCIIQTIERDWAPYIPKNKEEQFNRSLNRAKDAIGNKNINVPQTVAFLKNFKSKLETSMAALNSEEKKGFRTPSTKVKKAKKKNGRKR